MKIKQILEQLNSRARPGQLKEMAQYGMTIEKRFGITIPELRKMAKNIGQDHQLALQLW